MPHAYVTIRAEPMYRRQAIIDGLKWLGYTVEVPEGSRLSGRGLFPPEPKSRHDLLVMWNLKQGWDEDKADLFERRGGTVLVFENAYLQKHDKTRYAISVHGHCGSGWFPHDPQVDRFTALEYPILPRREEGSHILLCGQRGVGSAAMASPSGFIQNTKPRLEATFGRKVRVRPHPGTTHPVITLGQDLRNAWACAVWSSACGVRALTLGIPVFRGAPHWICEDVSHPLRRLEDINMAKFTYDQIKASLNRMAWGQWSVAEIESGEPFANMRDLGWGQDWA